MRAALSFESFCKRRRCRILDALYPQRHQGAKDGEPLQDGLGMEAKLWEGSHQFIETK